MIITAVKDLLAAYKLEDDLLQKENVNAVEFVCIKSYTCVDGHKQEFDSYTHVLIVYLDDKKVGP